MLRVYPYYRAGEDAVPDYRYGMKSDESLMRQPSGRGKDLPDLQPRLFGGTVRDATVLYCTVPGGDVTVARR